jgi:AcrR family transcriptional regulator
MGTVTVARTARERARAEITREIVEAARARLATDGAAGLSLRAVARDVGMVSSAVYRYFPSRDDLLTVLIVDSYDSLGDAAERAEEAVRRDDHAGRWLAVCRAVRDWALAHPHEYSLLYGSPVPGYAAPAPTTAPGTRIPRLLLRLLADAVAAGAAPDPGRVPAKVRPVVQAVLDSVDVPDGLPEAAVVRGLLAWAALFGAVSLEVFGQYGRDFPDARALFEHEMTLVAPF